MKFGDLLTADHPVQQCDKNCIARIKEGVSIHVRLSLSLIVI